MPRVRGPAVGRVLRGYVDAVKTMVPATNLRAARSTRRLSIQTRPLRILAPGQAVGGGLSATREAESPLGDKGSLDSLLTPA